MACVLIGAAQGSRVLSGQDLGPDQQIGGPVGLGQCSSHQRHLCFSWTSRNAELIQEESQTLQETETYENKQPVPRDYFVKFIH